MRKTWAFLLTSLLIWSGMAFGGDGVIVVIDNKLVKADKVVSPKITLIGAEQPVPLGEIVVIQAKVEDEYPTFVKKTDFEWTVTENGYVKRFWRDDNQVMFGAGVKSTLIKVDLKASFTYAIGTEDQIVVVTQKVEVKVGEPTPIPPPGPGPTPPPGPGPTPPPGPGPTPPPGPGPTPPPDPKPPVLTGTAKVVYDAGISSGPVNKASAAILATGFKDAAAQIGHNPEFSDPRSLLIKTKELNNSYLVKANYNPKDWDPWSTLIQDYLWSEYQGGRLKTLDDYKVFWQEVEKGLMALSTQ